MAWATIDLNTNRVIYIAGAANPFGLPQGKLEIDLTATGQGGGEIGWVYNPENNSVKPPPSFVMPVRCATTADLNIFTDVQIGDVIDGVTLAAGDRVLIKDLAAPAGNGIYLIYPSGNIPALQRSTDASVPSEMLGLTVRVLQGTVNGGSLWTCTTSPIPGPALDTDDLTFARLDPRGVYPQGADGTSLTADSSTVTDVAWVTPLNVQTFASSGTWTKPTSPRYTRAAIFICGSGGGGGSGRRGAASSVRNGGAGGGGGACAVVDIALSTLGSTETVTIGTGGAGGAAVTANDTNGNAGAAGSATSTFGTAIVQAGFGAGGAGGDASTSANVATFPGFGSLSGGNGAPVRHDGAVGSAGGGTNTGATVTLAGVVTTLSMGAAGGGAGGGVTSANSGTGGGAGGNNLGFSASGVAGGTGGGAGSGQTAGTAGAASPTGSTFGGKGGGGGASGASGAGTAGGVGGAPGGGAGGGGASVNGSNSGVGGAGANGYCAVVCY